MTSPSPELRDDGARTARPPSIARVTWLIAALELRRMLNRRPSAWRRSAARGGDRDKAERAAGSAPTKGSARTGTARKRAPGKVLLVFVSVTLAVNVITSTTRIVHDVAAAAERRDHPGMALVSRETLEGIAWVMARDPARVPAQFNERQQLRNMFEFAARDEGLHDDAARIARAEELTQIFERRGRAGFHESQVADVPWPSPQVWYASADPLAMLAPLGLIALLLSLAVMFFAVVGPDRDLAHVDSRLEWWFTFPVPARSLLFARVLQTALVSPMLWFLAAPFFAVVFWCAGWGAWGILAGLAAALYLGLLAGSLRVATETVLRRLLPLRSVAIVQAVIQLLGTLLLALTFASITRVGLDFIIERARVLAGWSLYNPLSLPLAWLHAAPRGLLSLTATVGLAVLGVSGSVSLGSSLLRDGLASSSSPLLGARRASAGRLFGASSTARSRAPGRASTLGAIAHQELRSITRDPRRLLSVLVLPLVMIGVQGLLNPAFFRAILASPNNAAAAAFAIGSLALSSGALLTLAIEVPALWLLYSAPCSLDRVLLQKAAFWSVLATLFSALGLLGLGIQARDAALVLNVHGLLALLGTALYGFIAVALGALGTDVLEGELSRRTQPSTMRLFMLLAALFCFALYTPSVWSKFAQLSLSGLLAFALWQKVRDHTPYLLDPTEAPPPRIAVSDGIIAALAFFVAQGLLSLLFQQLALSPGLSLLFAFVGAGLMVTAGTLYVFVKAGMPALATTLGLATPEPGSGPTARAALEGFVAGLLGSLCAVVYATSIERVEWLRRLYSESERLDPSPRLLPWLCVLAVFAAPLFEEFIFRGVLYRGFRRSLSPLQAALASSLVFALVHPPLAFVPVFALALLAATVFERSRLLLAPIVAHMTYNAIVVAFTLAAQT